MVLFFYTVLGVVLRTRNQTPNAVHPLNSGWGIPHLVKQRSTLPPSLQNLPNQKIPLLFSFARVKATVDGCGQVLETHAHNTLCNKIPTTTDMQHLRHEWYWSTSSTAAPCQPVNRTPKSPNGSMGYAARMATIEWPRNVAGLQGRHCTELSHCTDKAGRLL